MPNNPYAWRMVLALLALALLTAVCVSRADDADATHGRGFEPTPSTLDCINRAEGSPQYDSDDSRIYRGRYQADRAFEVAYAVNLIPPVHWWATGSHTWDRADRWHPRIQDEMARNGVRARGLQPWPPASRSCPRR